MTSFLDYVLEILSNHGNITTKSMFGGYGIYKDKIIVAIVISDELYFKVDDQNKENYIQMKSEPFSYTSNGKRVAMSYWKVPIDVLEDSDLLKIWLEKSYDASIRKKKTA